VHALYDPVIELMRRVAAEVVMPRFRALAEHEIIEKTPGDLVTVADRESEVRLTEGLHALDPAARVIGEEAVSADASLLEGIGEGRVWIVDPIDGTHNFAAGQAPFGLMIALVIDGDAEAAWLLDPITGRVCHASRGGGAFVNGERVAARETGADRPIASLATLFMTVEERERVTALAAPHFELVPIPRCAAEQYPRLCLGVNDVSVFRRTLPWDHAPGALFLNEAGGRAARWDGTPYRVGDGMTGMLAASSPKMWERAAAILRAAG
jgi:fructose-1,6-bisphosphatase/inositol monophosphatase family enzyme